MIAAKAMTSNPIAIPVETTVRDAIATLRQHHLHDLPVVDESGKPVGMITARAILHAAVPAYASSELLDVIRGGPDLPSVYEHLGDIANKGVGEVMDTGPCLVQCATATSAVAAMLVNMHADTHNALVVDEDGLLVGTISALDIVGRTAA
ncbi:MAG: CBS domain-containing protein [Mariprofundaceae bacterium]